MTWRDEQPPHRRLEVGREFPARSASLQVTGVPHPPNRGWVANGIAAGEASAARRRARPRFAIAEAVSRIGDFPEAGRAAGPTNTEDCTIRAFLTVAAHLSR